MNKLFQIIFFLIPIVGNSQIDTVARLYAFGGNDNDNAEEVAATLDGGYIVIGSTSSNSWGNTDAYLLKVDSLCNYEWSKAIGGGNNDWGYSIKQTIDKGYIIAASSNSFSNGGYDAILMKRDSLGNYEWKKVYGGQDWDFAYSVVQTYDSGYVFCGETYNNSNGYSDVYIVKTNPLGDTLWTRSYGGALIDKGNSIIETSDSNIVVAGITTSIIDSTDIYVIKLTPNGTLLWDSIYSDVLYDDVNTIIETVNGDYVLSGSTTSASVGGDLDYMIKRIDANGNLLWNQTLVNGPVPTPEDEEAFDVFELPNTNLLISGYSETGHVNKNVAFFELTSGGWWGNSSTVIQTGDDDFVKSVTIGNNGSILGAGSVSSFGAGMDDLLLVRLDTLYPFQDTATTVYLDNTPLIVKEVNTLNEISLYPNPVHSSFSIFSKNKLTINSIHIVDIVGKEVLSLKTNSNMIDVSSLTNGVYYVQVIYDSKHRYRAKIIKY